MKKRIVDDVIQYNGPYCYVDGRILQLTNNIGTFKVKHQDRAQGQSNYNFRRLFRLWLITVINFSIVPLRIAVALGFIAFFAGIAGVVVILFEYFFIHKTPTGWASLFVFMSLFSGTQMLLLGVIGEYLGRIYMTLNRTPQYSIEHCVTSDYYK